MPPGSSSARSGTGLRGRPYRSPEGLGVSPRPVWSRQDRLAPLRNRRSEVRILSGTLWKPRRAEPVVRFARRLEQRDAPVWRRGGRPEGPGDVGLLAHGFYDRLDPPE